MSEVKLGDHIGVQRTNGHYHQLTVIGVPRRNDEIRLKLVKCSDLIGASKAEVAMSICSHHVGKDTTLSWTIIRKLEREGVCKWLNDMALILFGE